ncbi:MAG: PAS domain-containing protein [Candidatus Nomurabacteria bacterium]|nr:MAG: PAS domain-containing protein [Candidatus Nomurabacteria bacterium]HRV76258.1 PAS domain-containing protein [Candidatus Saccharimonadales bacterium]
MTDSNPELTKNNRQPKRESNEWRCECGKLLFKGAFLAGLIEVKCSRCKRMVYLQQFNAYTADNPSFMTTMSQEGTILTVSQGLFDALGYAQEEVTGKSFLDFLNPKLHLTALFWIESIAENKHTNNPYSSLIVPLLTKEDEEKIFSVLIRPAHLGGKDIYIVLAEAGKEAADSQEQKVLSKIAQKDRKRRENWDFIIDDEGTILEVSGKSDFGYKKEDLIGNSLIKTLEINDKKLSNQLKIQESYVFTTKLKSKDDKQKEYKACFTPDFIVEPGDKQGFIVAFRPLEAQRDSSTSQTSAA